jgi:hypothetical protein
MEKMEEWQGVRRRYWALSEYRLPVCRFLSWGRERGIEILRGKKKDLPSVFVNESGHILRIGACSGSQCRVPTCGPLYEGLITITRWVLHDLFHEFDRFHIMMSPPFFCCKYALSSLFRQIKEHHER